MAKLPHSILEEYKTQAALLLKQLHSDNQELAADAAKRFQQLARIADYTPLEITDSPEIKLKHALNVIALEQGFAAWADLKHDFERKERFRAERQASRFTLVYPRRCAAFINEWHAHYDTASQELGEMGGYLFPYKNQFFICQSSYIEALGLDPLDPDWERIGWNWVEPADREAWERLEAKLRQISAEIA